MTSHYLGQSIGSFGQVFAVSSRAAPVADDDSVAIGTFAPLLHKLPCCTDHPLAKAIAVDEC